MNQPTLPADPAHAACLQQRANRIRTLSPAFQQVANYQWSNYNAGYAKLEQRLKGGLSYIVSYTFSKCIDSGSPAAIPARTCTTAGSSARCAIPTCRIISPPATSSIFRSATGAASTFAIRS